MNTEPAQAKKRLLRIFGAALALAAGLYFVLHAKHAFAGKDLSGLFDPKVAVAATILTALYTASIVATAVAWTRLLHGLGQTARFRWLLPVLATTQFGKYIPGNVAQHVSRVALTRNLGVPLPVAVFSVVCELLLALVASAQVAAVSLWWMPPVAFHGFYIGNYRLWILFAVFVATVVMLATVARAAGWLTRRRGVQVELLQRSGLDTATTLTCCGMYAIGFVMIGCGMWFVGHAIQDTPNYLPSPIFFIGAFASSWILGFVAPGAPAGLGIREAILSVWLGAIMPATQVVFLVVVLRIATTAGDLINFMWSSYFTARLRSQHPPTTPSILQDR